MASVEVKSFESPDEERPFEGKGKASIINIAGRQVGRAIFEPGWRWSQNVKPIAGTESCQVHHVGYVVSGRMKIHMDDGSEAEVGPGDAYEIPPGHDAEVIGDETCVMIDVGEPSEFAKRQ